MILGVGADLTNIERIQKTLDRFGQRFKDRVFTEVEQAKAQKRKDFVGTYAKRWAAKEACSKALGTGLSMGISWSMQLTGWAAERMAEMTPVGYKAFIHITLTDDHPWAQAFVVIEARPISQ
ncbi:MAG: holo-ACP synthase [Rhodobacterales bacterium]